MRRFTSTRRHQRCSVHLDFSSQNSSSYIKDSTSLTWNLTGRRRPWLPCGRSLRRRACDWARRPLVHALAATNGSTTSSRYDGMDWRSIGEVSRLCTHGLELHELQGGLCDRSLVRRRASKLWRTLHGWESHSQSQFLCQPIQVRWFLSDWLIYSLGDLYGWLNSIALRKMRKKTSSSWRPRFLDWRRSAHN